MKLIFLAVFTVALVRGEFSEDNEDTDDLVDLQPCQEKSNPVKYVQFVHRHILGEKFDRSDLQEWAE